MTLTLTPELEQFIQRQVSSGHYRSPQELVKMAVARLMLDRTSEALDDATLEAIGESEEQFDRGEGRPFDVVAQELLKKRDLQSEIV